MAKYRHRIFEMYEFRDEAVSALMPDPAHRPTPSPATEPWHLQHLTVSTSAGVTHLKFKQTRAFGDETANELREDFAQLADRLAKDSKVLLDFDHAESFGAAAIDELVLFKQKLRMKGSRIALCCLEHAARTCFFAVRSS